MKTKCIFCNVVVPLEDSWILAICKPCLKVKNDATNKVMLSKEVRDKLVESATKELKQAMTGHSCGQERCFGSSGECAEKLFSSTCIGCCPDTEQHYRGAVETIFAWFNNAWEVKIMKDWLLVKKK